MISLIYSTNKILISKIDKKRDKCEKCVKTHEMTKLSEKSVQRVKKQFFINVIFLLKIKKGFLQRIA